MAPDPFAGLAAPLRAALVAAEFSHDAVSALIGAQAHAALARNETTPALRRTRGGSPLETLTRLFLLQTRVSDAEAERALPGLVGRMATAGILRLDGDEVAAGLDVRPYSDGSRDLWVVSDLTPGLDGGGNRVGPDHVLGISPASTSLARLTRRDPVGAALDLGTGCGVQALHLAGHSRRVVATDVNRRALDMARLTAALNGVEVEVREGSFFEPVAGERFDLVVSNPPFVVSPATGQPLAYRDSGLPGDRAVEHLVRTAPDHLRPGGWCQLLANWLHTEDRPWSDRLADWLDGRCDAFVVQREVVDPAAYVELWLADAGLRGHPDYRRRYDEWLAWFAVHRVSAVGLGWVNLRRRAGDPAGAVVELLDWPYEVEQPVSAAVDGWAAGQDALAGTVDLLAAHLLVRPDVRQETAGLPGAADPETILLRQQRGLRRARRVDTVEAALVGACDGDLSLGEILDAVAALLGREPSATRTAYLPAVRSLVAEGFLILPATGPTVAGPTATGPTATGPTAAGPAAAGPATGPAEPATGPTG